MLILNTKRKYEINLYTFNIDNVHAKQTCPTVELYKFSK